MQPQTPVISTVLLNWNRSDLLRSTLRSYLETISVRYELIIVDNGSQDDSPAVIREVCEGRPDVRPLLLSENHGGDALNIGLAQAHGEFLHVSENDIEYLPGWDAELLAKLEVFPEVGQLSVFGLGPDSPHYRFGRLLERDRATVLVTSANVGSTSLFRRAIWDAGAKWQSCPGQFKGPDDVAFSAAVRDAGYVVAWNDRTVIVNHGHTVEEWIGRLPYYIASYSGKPYHGLKGFRERLRAAGYDLIQTDDGRWEAVALSDPDVLE
jgi:glycosyltransferase involved in cell wall biosynthesis